VPELRTRTERQHAFADHDEVLATLNRLASRDEPLVVEIGRLSGQREPRWAHLLGGPVDVEALAATRATAPPAGPARSELAAELAELRARVERIERELGLDMES
jgi:uncharacterized protein YceH (UPF0502 family)